jgi:hypothetical protein
MTPPARALRLLRLGIALLVVGACVATLVVRDLEIATSVLIGVSALLFVSSVVIVLVRRMDAPGLHDASLTYYFQPPVVNVGVALVCSVAALGTLALGIGFLSIGNVIGWGLVLCGAAGLVSLAFEMWIARRTLDDSGWGDAGESTAPPT